MNDRTFRAADARASRYRQRLASPAFAQRRPAARPPANRPRLGPTRPTSRRRRRGFSRRRTARCPTRPKSSSPRPSARRICRTFRSASRRSALGSSTSSTSRTSRITPSSCRRSASRPPQPGATVVYMRGVATGGDGNHSGSLPSVGVYLDEQPVTTIGGTLDVHIYDIARIESLAGPQGTLYGASSEAGTIRIITNKPELGVTSGRVDGEINRVAHGGMGGKLEGMINLPIAGNIAFRGVAFYQRDAGYIDNVFGAADLLRRPDLSIPMTATIHRLRPQRHHRQQCRPSSRRTSTTIDDLWRPRGAQDRPRRQLDRHADDHAPEDQGQRRLLLRSDAGRPQDRSASARSHRTRQVHPGRADHRGQDRQFRHHLCRRLHGPADVRHQRLHRLCRRLRRLLRKLRRHR